MSSLGSVSLVSTHNTENCHKINENLLFSVSTKENEANITLSTLSFTLGIYFSIIINNAGFTGSIYYQNYTKIKQWTKYKYCIPFLWILINQKRHYIMKNDLRDVDITCSRCSAPLNVYAEYMNENIHLMQTFRASNY